jgi:hypothetical protein
VNWESLNRSWEQLNCELRTSGAGVETLRPEIGSSGSEGWRSVRFGELLY